MLVLSTKKKKNLKKKICFDIKCVAVLIWQEETSMPRIPGKRTMKNTANCARNNPSLPSPQPTSLNGAQKATVAHFSPLQPLHRPTLACK